MKLTKLFLLISLLLCLLKIKAYLSSSFLKRIKHKNDEPEKKELLAKCSNTSECEDGLVCSHDKGKDIKQCEEEPKQKEKCNEFKRKFSRCLRKSNQICSENKECYNDECIYGKCRISEKQFLAVCNYHYLSEECEENTYCAVSGITYKCLGGVGHRCEEDHHCYNGSCGLPGQKSPKTCNINFGKVLKNTNSWVFKDVHTMKLQRPRRNSELGKNQK